MVDAGRLSAAPLPAAGAAVRPTVLDACLDALTAVALVADEVGDRCGAIAFDDEVRVGDPPRPRAGAAVVRALFDLQPRAGRLRLRAAFRRVEGAKRAFVLVLCDLLEESAARPLVEAMPVLTRRHAVVVASPADPQPGRARRAHGAPRARALARRSRRAAARRGAAQVRRRPPPAPRALVPRRAGAAGAVEAPRRTVLAARRASPAYLRGQGSIAAPSS